MEILTSSSNSETYPPQLLHVKAKKLRKATGNSNIHTEFEHPERSFANVLKTALTRPFKLLGTQQIVQVLAVYMAYVYGLTYLGKCDEFVIWLLAQAFETSSVSIFETKHAKPNISYSPFNLSNPVDRTLR